MSLETLVGSGRSFPEVLSTLLGGPRIGDDEAAVRKAYKKALVEHHPDRCAARGLSAEASVAAEETYKLLQVLHEKWEKGEKKRAARAAQGFQRRASSSGKHGRR